MNSPIGPLAYASKYQNQKASLPSESIKGKIKVNSDSMTNYGLAQNKQVIPLVVQHADRDMALSASMCSKTKGVVEKIK